MDTNRVIYAIYPFDERGHIAGVYVGSTTDLKRRLQIHLNDKDPNKPQAFFHSLMRENGYCFQILETITKGEKSLEYDWIDFFAKKTDLTVFNSRSGCFSADHKRCEKPWGVPMFLGGGVVWRYV